MMNIKTGFLLVGLWITFFAAQATHLSYDSLGITKKAGQTFIIHEVEEGETLFSLSRRYHVAVDLISQENPEVEAGLKIGQKLLIPLVKGESKKHVEGLVHTVKPSETLFSISRRYNVTTDQLKKWNNLSDNNISIGQKLAIKENGSLSQTTSTETIDYTGKKTHTVAPSETLFSISRQYNVGIDDLKKWNKLNGNELAIGQMLIVSSGTTAIAANSSMLPSHIEEKENPMEESAVSAIDVSEIKTPEVAIGPAANEGQTMDSKKIIESGFAQVIEGSSETKKYLALHKSAPVGTIMQVKNTMNNQTVFVRVVGALPNTGENNKVLLKISKKAFDRLGAVDSKFPVEISYVP